MQLDQILGLAARAIQAVVDPLGRSGIEARDDEGILAGKEEVQVLPDRLFPHRHRRDPISRGQALSRCRHRWHEQIRFRAIGQKDRKYFRIRLPRQSRPRHTRSTSS